MAIIGLAVLWILSASFEKTSKIFQAHLIASAFGLMRSGTAFLLAFWLESAWRIESIDVGPIGAMACTFATVVTGCRVLRVLEGDFGWYVSGTLVKAVVVVVGARTVLRALTTLGLAIANETLCMLRVLCELDELTELDNDGA
jgi:hypothetical protein